MNDACAGEVVIFVAALFDPVAQINVFSVHEKLLVQQTDLTQYRTAHPHEGPAEHIDRVGRIGRKIAEVIATKSFAFGKNSGQPEGFTKSHPRTREAPFTFGQESAGTIDHPNTQATGFGVFFHKIETVAKGIFPNHRIGVEQQHVAPLRKPDRLIIGLGKTGVIRIGDQLYFGELRPHHGHAVVLRMVIDDEHFRVHTAHRPPYRKQGLLQKMTHVVIDDDDGKLHGAKNAEN